MLKISVFFQLLLRIFASFALLSFIGGCASEQELIKGKANSVTDEVSYEVNGIHGQLLENVEKALSSLPAVSKKNAFIFSREIRDKTKKALRALGYYRPKIEIIAPDPKGALNTVEINVDSGKATFIRNCEVEILGEGAKYEIFSTLVKKSGIEPYKRLDHGSYESLKNDLKNAALELGFFDYKLIVSQIVVFSDEDKADIALIADTGKRYVFGKLKSDAETLELLKPARKLFKLQEGVPFSSEALKKFQTDMSRTGYYSSVDVRAAVEKRDKHKVPLELHLERKKNNQMRTGIGFSSDEDLRIMLAWDKPLLNEEGHSFSSYARLSKIRQNAEIVYKIPRKDPNLDYYYLRAAQIHTDFNDTKSDLSHLSVHYVADITGKWRRDYSLRGEYEDYTQGREKGFAIDVIPGLLLSRRETSGGTDPEYGYDISGDFTGGSSLWSDYNFFRAVLSFRGIVSPSEDTRLLLRLTGGAIVGSDAYKVPPSLRFFAGGDRSVRGFSYMSQSPKQDGFLKGGRYLATGTAELQFPIGISSSRGAVFLDAGKAFDTVGKQSMLWGPGIGYRYLSRYGAASVDLAVGVSDTDHGFKLHFSFGPEF